MTTVNTFQKAVIQKCNQMGVDEASRFLHLIGQFENVSMLEIEIGKFWAKGCLVMQARFNGQLIREDCTVMGLLGVNPIIKETVITPAHRELIKQALNDNAKAVLEEIEMF